MKLRKGQSRIELPPYSVIRHVLAKEKGDQTAYRLVPMNLSEIERMRKQDPSPCKKPTYFAESHGGLELMSAARMPMDVIVRYMPPEEEV